LFEVTSELGFQGCRYEKVMLFTFALLLTTIHVVSCVVPYTKKETGV